ncbi:isoprenylcysteine carboxylmethyltransferase family protein [Rhodococcus spelaei]|uniref:Isoprenylcysteine carboxylmethyltransferase family protein n=1 Tax=Rhodococcus spelaei TaxID=2546320 RepID=A0A541BNI0_9NOCA|nr:isoprenylcysteine carboxylmethyltransferase family protein [Rhodococcus spelaei]TQF73869.1 isoprenylcysteine carboxylmethyltransferase family protein [Rhodococcus spelaei]
MSEPDRVLPLFATNPVAGAVLAAAFAAWVVSEYRIGRTRPTQSRPGDLSGAAVGLGLLVAYFGGLAVSVLATATVIVEGQWWWFAAGLVVAASGQGLRLRAVRELGSSFTFRVQTVPGQAVVDTGPYRRIRHPSYTGALICALGFTIAYTNWLAPLAVLGLALAYVVRIPHEERVLAAEIGEPYRRYMARTRRLIPFVF